MTSVKSPTYARPPPPPPSGLILIGALSILRIEKQLFLSGPLKILKWQRFSPQQLGASKELFCFFVDVLFLFFIEVV